VHSIIGYGAPEEAGTRERMASRWAKRRSAPQAVLRLAGGAQFLVPRGVREHFAERMGARGLACATAWTELLARYRGAYPELAAELDQMDPTSSRMMGRRHPAFLPTRRPASRDRLAEGAERHRPARAVAAGRPRPTWRRRRNPT